jgi:hypothetical protein
MSTKMILYINLVVLATFVVYTYCKVIYSKIYIK